MQVGALFSFVNVHCADILEASLSMGLARVARNHHVSSNAHSLSRLSLIVLPVLWLLSQLFSGKNFAECCSTSDLLCHCVVGGRVDGCCMAVEIHLYG